MVDIVSRTHCLQATEDINLSANVLEYAITSTYATIKSVHYIDEKVTNGTMETDANWSAINSATVAQSATQANGGTYSFKITTDAEDEGAKSDTFTTTDNIVYYYRAYIFPEDGTSMNIQVIAGDGTTSLLDSDETLTEDAWNLVAGSFTETSAGSSAYVAFRSPTDETGTDNYYIDDVSIYSQRRALTKSSPEIVGQTAHETEPRYWYDWSGKIGVYPELGTVSAEKITLYLITRPTAIAATANVTTPAIYDTALVYYIIAQAMLEDLKPTKYLQMMSLYDNELRRLRGDLVEYPAQVVE